MVDARQLLGMDGHEQACLSATPFDLLDRLSSAPSDAGVMPMHANDHGVDHLHGSERHELLGDP